MPLSAFLDADIPDEPQLVPGLIPGGAGLLILAGLPKKKKTMLALDLFARFEDGGMWLGRPVTPTPAVYIFLEGQRKGLQRRLRRLIGTWKSETKNWVAVRPRKFRLDTEPGVERLLDFIAQAEARAVFIDPFVFSHGVDENDNGKMGALMQRLSAIADSQGVLIILIHHQSKTGRDGDSRSIRGAGALAGATEANLLLSEQARGHRLVAELRDDEGADLSLRFDPDTLRFSVDESAEAPRRRRPKDLVVSALQDAGEPLRVEQIAERASISKTSVSSALTELSAEGIVLKLPQKVGKAHLFEALAA